jgi:hypothetical protein
MHSLFPAAGFVLAAVAIACRPGSSPDHAARPPAAEALVTGGAGDSLELSLAGPAEVPAGHRVHFTFQARNTASRPLGLYLLGRTPTLDVEVSRPTGDPVWRRLEGEVIPAILQVRTLAPGERLAAEVDWDQRTRTGAPARPGEYVARARLLTEDGNLSAPPMSFRIVGP